MVVKALKAAIDSNTQIREEMTFFSLLAAPGYPELADEMLALNVDRKETAFIIVNNEKIKIVSTSGNEETIDLLERSKNEKASNVRM